MIIDVIGIIATILRIESIDHMVIIFSIISFIVNHMITILLSRG